MEERFIISIERERETGGWRRHARTAIIIRIWDMLPVWVGRSWFPPSQHSIVTDLYYIDVLLSKNTGGV
jgi:hypothetical protein